MLPGSSGSITIRPISSCSRMLRSERITGRTVAQRTGRLGFSDRRCERSSEAEHQLPKLRTRVRFPSLALQESAARGQHFGSLRGAMSTRLDGRHDTFMAWSESA